MVRKVLACFGLLVASILGSSIPGQNLQAQGIFIESTDGSYHLPRPRPTPAPPESAYKIKELAVAVRIDDQVGRVQVSQTVVNTGSRQMEVSFCFPLPYDGAIDQMTFMVDGKEYEAKLLDAKEARAIYEGYVRKNQDPALLEWIGTGMFRTSVFPVPPGAGRVVTINYSQVLRKSDRLTDFLYPLAAAKFTSQPIETVSFAINISSKAKLKSVYSPSHPVDVQRPDDHHAIAKIEAKGIVPSSDFRLFFDTAESELGASLLTYRPNSQEDGYFLLLASPEVKSTNAKLPPKTVIFALDRSGSMSGKKIEQAKQALKFVINNLREADLFNIVVYDGNVESFQPELQRYDETTRKAAMTFIDGIYTGGSTNISGALTTSLKMIQDASRPNYVVFLTDGLPTAGEKNELKISELTKQLNHHRTRIISFGVGYDVNSRLLDRLTRDNFGSSQFVRPDEDIEQHVSKLYQRMSQPVMTDVKLTVEVDSPSQQSATNTNRVYPRQLHDIFAGDQMVVLGRYRTAGHAKVSIEGVVGDSTSKLHFPVELTASSNDHSFAFVEKLWALRRVGEIIDELDLNGKNDELISELVTLSSKHGILTPYTSFLADETVNVRDLASNDNLRRRTNENLKNLEISEGASGVEQRAGKRMLLDSKIANADAFGSGGAAREGQPSGYTGPGSAAGASAALTPNSITYFDATKNRHVTTDAVQTVGQTTLFRRGKTWVAEDARDADLDNGANKIQTIARFSDDYFKLVAANSPDENAVLARQNAGEEFILKLRGQYYRIKDATR